MNMKEKLRTGLERINARNRIHFFIPILSLVIFLLFYLVPFLSTNINGDISYINGYQAFSLFQDSQSIIHYASGLLIVSLILSCCLAIPSLIGLLGEERHTSKAAISTIAIYLVKLLVEVAVTILFGQTQTNIVPSFGSYLIPSLTLVLGFVFALVYINFRDKEGKIFHKKDSEETSEKQS